MRQLNKIPKDVHRFLDQGFSSPAPLYYDSTGNKTTNIEDCQLDAFGQPVFAGSSDTVFNPHYIYDMKRPLTFNPSDPSSRALAFEARSNFENQTSIPNVYGDKFEAMSYANNVSDILVPKLRALKNSITETPKSK